MTNPYIPLIDEALSSLIPDLQPEVLIEAMRYSLLSPGKRLRSSVLLMTCKAFGGNVLSAMPFACALECIHAYSLIHDDLPSLDNDDFRRGKSSCHKAYGEAMAILAGDALLNLAYETMSKATAVKPDKANANAMNVIAQSAGYTGMVAGQVLDIQSNNKTDNGTLYIYENKTAKLFAAAFAAGGYLAGLDEKAEQLYRIGILFGTAFQIKDDLLDKTSKNRPGGSDERNEKFTYLFFGEDNAKNKAESLLNEARELLDGLKERSRDEEFSRIAELFV